MRAKKRRIGLRGLLLLLLALLVYLLLPGILPSPGSGNRGAEAREGAAGAHPASAGDDRLAGRAARLSFLLAEERIAPALLLARAMSEKGETERERELGQRYLGRIQATGLRLETEYRDALERGSWLRAERLLGELEESFPERHRRLARELGLGALEEPGSSLAALLAPVLPLVLNRGELLWKLRGRKAVLKTRGESGGYRYRSVDVADLDPLEVHRMLSGFRSGGGSARRALEAFSRTYREAGRSVHAALALNGRPADPDRAPRGGGSRQ